jgi:hypothetical protein
MKVLDAKRQARHRGTAIAFYTLATSLVAACAPDPAVGGPRRGIGHSDAGIGTRDASLGSRPRGFAVVSSDYTVTSVGLLDAAGAQLRDDFIDSGSASTGLVTALSGDVVLPTQSGEHGVLALLDRFRTDIITRVDLDTGAVLGQVKAQGAGSYSSNPHDYVYVDASSAWVTRYEPNLDAAGGDPDLGLDLLRIDPSRFVRTQDRVDFAPWNSTSERKNPNTGATDAVTVYARPSSIVRLGHQLVVGMATLSAAFDAAGAGLVALVDLDQKRVKMLELAGLQGCDDVAPVPNDTTRVAVACSGFFRGSVRDGSGLAMLVLEQSELTIEHAWHASDDTSSALTTYALVAVNATEVLAMAAGEDANGTEPQTHDKLYRVNLMTGEQQIVFEAEGRYVIGPGAFDPQSGLLLVPDASVDNKGRPTAGVHRFVRRGDGSFEARGPVKLDAILPARQVRPFE